MSLNYSTFMYLPFEKKNNVIPYIKTRHAIYVKIKITIIKKGVNNTRRLTIISFQAIQITIIKFKKGFI